ncbi:unnamed protein product [Rotaria sordida]|uniref:MULE transposase domain-containing protein n=1 Tax=Rotaria sordida TaxID=392033 RepID=A0A815FGE2_9BILA|nr:unnamed protein product [Rotaria sordida]
MYQNFLLCHNRLASILGFASPMAVQLLGANEHWNSDGTFRTAPKLFYQSYSIHVWDDFSMKPAIYAALPNKKFDTYDIFLNELIMYAKSYGLITYSKDDEVRRQISNILMLPLLPPEEIDLAFADIIEDLSNINEKFLKLTDYILRTYIEEALFPPCFWNLFSFIGVRPKTNNHLEGYHGQLNSHCQTHPNLWAWIRYVQESEESTMVRVEQEHAQQWSTRPKRLTSVTNENILIQAKQDYSDGLLDLKYYQQRLRSLGYRYINVFDTFDKDDLDYEPQQISASTICHHFHEYGYRNVLPRTTHMLTSDDRKRRVQWTKQHQNDDFKRTIFTNESSFQLFRNTIRRWTKHPKNESKCAPKNRQKVRIWGTVSVKDVLTCHTFRFNLDSPYYVYMLKNFLLAAVRHK